MGVGLLKAVADNDRFGLWRPACLKLLVERAALMAR